MRGFFTALKTGGKLKIMCFADLYIIQKNLKIIPSGLYLTVSAYVCITIRTLLLAYYHC